MVAQKGGTGKSLITAHLGVAFCEAGLTVLVVDLDPQANLVKWAKDRPEDAMPVVIPADPERLPHVMETARKEDIGLVIFDTPPHTEKSSLAAIRAADLIVVPTRPRVFDLQSIGDTVALLNAARRRSSAVALLNSAKNARSPVLDEAAEVIAGFGLEVAPMRILDRDPFAHALTVSKGITEYEPTGKAAAEIRELMQFLAGKLGLTLPKTVP